MEQKGRDIHSLYRSARRETRDEENRARRGLKNTLELQQMNDK